MAYFADEKETNRIRVLYFINAFSVPLSKTQIASAFFDEGWLGYFETVLLIDELEAAALIASRPCAFGPGYALTAHGEETLKTLSAQLPISAKSAVDSYIAEYGKQLLRMEQFYARSVASPSGGYDVILRAYEADRMLLGVVINLPDADLARRACDNWVSTASTTYAAVLDAILEAKTEK